MSDDTLSPETAKSLLSIPVVKSGTAKLFVEVSTERLPDNYYTEALKQGLKVMVNGGASKITKETYPVDGERFEAARALAAQRVEEMYTSKLKIAGDKKASAGASGKEMTEARRIAKEIIKDALKAAGHKVSQYKASDITKAANDLIDRDPEILATAKANLDKRGKVADNAANALTSALSGISADPDLIAKSEKKDLPLSAKQAGMTKPHHGVTAH